MPTHEAEWQTQKQRIDKRLRESNPAWKIVRHTVRSLAG